MTDEQRKQIEETADLRKDFYYGLEQSLFVESFKDGAEFGLSLVESRIKELESELKEFSWRLDDIANTLRMAKNIAKGLTALSTDEEFKQANQTESCFDRCIKGGYKRIEFMQNTLNRLLPPADNE